MAKVGYDSRIRIAIEWYDNEAEAQRRAADLHTEYDPSTLAAANVGITQCGRAASFDRTVNGQRQYAVVVP